MRTVGDGLGIVRCLDQLTQSDEPGGAAVKECDHDGDSAKPPPFVYVSSRSGNVMAADPSSLREAFRLGPCAHPRGGPEPDVRMRCTSSGAWLVVEVAGELDLQAVPLLDELGSDPCLVVLDLHEVTFMDCSGVRALLDARRRAGAAGGAVRLAAPSRHVRRLLELTHLGRAVPTFDSVSEALAEPLGRVGDHTGPGQVHPRPRAGRRRRTA